MQDKKTKEQELKYMFMCLEDVMEFGRSKYKTPILDRIEKMGGKDRAVKERIDACYRHLSQCTCSDEQYLIDANKLDNESKLPHLYHAFFNLGMAIYMHERGEETAWWVYT